MGALLLVSAVVAVSVSQAQQAGGAGLTRVPFGGIKIPLEGEAAVAGAPTLQRVFQNLTFSKPLFLTSVPGTTPEMLAVIEQDGRVIVFPNDSNTRQSKVLIDIRNRVGQGGANERGALGIAFDKDFTTNGFFYLYYTGPGQSAVSAFTNFIDRYQVTDLKALTTTPATRCQVFSFAHPQSNHNSGSLLVDKDGFLYLPIGDGGAANDRGTGHSPNGNGQDITDNPLGSILRMKVDTSNPRTCDYSTAGNPFSNAAGNADQGGDREIFALGMRNPYRSSFDSKTGDLWIGDVGQNTREEVDFISRADIDAVISKKAPAPNFGWPCFEGTVRGPIVTATCDTPAKVRMPVFDFDSGNQASVIGGYLYRGTALPQLAGQYIYGDFGNQLIRVLDPSKPGAGGRLPDRRLLSTATSGGRPWAIGQDRQGELFAVFGSSNQIRKIMPAATSAAAPAAGAPGAGTLATGAIPKMLSETGFFQNTAGFVTAPGVVPYEVNSKLFSDGLEKMRFIAIPGNGKIRFDAMGRFDFPVGTVLAKQFDKADRRVETRFLVRGSDQWRGYTYEWLPDQRDAMLVSEDLKTVQLAGGQMYDLPSRSDCQACHNRGSSTEPLQIIGFQARQLNFPIMYPKDANSGGTGVMDNQIRALNAAGFFSQDVGDLMRLSLFPTNPTKPDELSRLSNADINSRARSFLESNCAPCHRPGGNTPTPIDLQRDTPNEKMLIFQAPPGEGDVDGAKLIIDAGRPDNSILLKRMLRVVGKDQQGMPPISHRLMDMDGIALIRAWINAIDAKGNPKP